VAEFYGLIRSYHRAAVITSVHCNPGIPDRVVIYTGSLDKMD